MTYRTVKELLRARMASDGDGVRLMRVFGGNDLARFDPFLMMDEFGSDRPGDYIGGFPSHPHRGFETITYMLEGHMEHQDHMGNVGDLKRGDVQWMTAGSGVIHSEMPKQQEGMLQGFQVWLNLPARTKMQAASWQDVSAGDIPVYELDGITVKAIAGQLSTGQTTLRGAVQQKFTEPGYLDVHFEAGPGVLDLEIPDGHTVLVYVYQGSMETGEADAGTRVDRGVMARMSGFGRLLLKGEADTRLIVLSGKPLGEPIVHYGPFVMNTREEIEQALVDYRDGRLTA